MKKIIPAAVLMMAAQSALAATGPGSVPFTDSFSYSNGTLGTVSNGVWTFGGATGGTNADTQVTSTSLTYISPITGTTALPAPVGGSVILDGGSSKVDRAGLGTLPTPGNDQPFTIYYSLTLDVTNLSGMTPGGGFIAGFNDSIGTVTTQVSQAGARLQIRQGSDASHFNVGIRNDVSTGNGTAAAAYDPTNFTAGTTVFVVAAYQHILGSSTNDITSVWVNPDPATFGSQVAPPTLITSTGDDLAAANFQIQSFFLRQIGVGGKTIIVDDVRVDNSWASVAPLQWTNNVAGTWSTNANWTTNTAPNAAGVIPSFVGSATGVTVTLDSNRTAGGLTFNANSGSAASAFTIASTGGAILSLEGAPALAPAITVNSGNQIINSPISLNADTTVFVSSTANTSLTMSGPISGAGGIVKSGTSPLFLTGNNSFTGAVTINAGFLRVNSDTSFGAVPAAPTVDVNLNAGLLFDSSFAVNANRTLVIGAGGKFSTNGNNATWAGKITGTGSLEKVSSGTLLLTGPNDYTGNTTVTNGTLALGSSLTSSPSIVISTASSITLPANGSHVLSTGALAMDATATLDLNDNDLILNYSGSSPIGTVRSLLVSGFNSGGWNGKGIASTVAGTTSSGTAGLGYAEATDVGLTTLDGVSIPGTAVVVKYTYYGDSNLDGTVGTDDFQRFLDGFAGGGNTWLQGDYTYDGVVDLGNDFNLFLSGYMLQGGSLGDLAPIIATDTELTAGQKASLLTVVPEPSSIAAIAVAATGLAARRRRRIA